MRHFLYAVTSNDPAPVGDGDAVSWLCHYKFRNDDEVYIPMPPALEEIQPGDGLWFSTNDELQGLAIVLRVEDDAINNRKEIWFAGWKIRFVTTTHETHLKTAVIEQGKADRWMQLLEAP